METSYLLFKTRNGRIGCGSDPAGGSPRPYRRTMKRWALVIGLIAALSVAGCTNGGGGDAADPQSTTAAARSTAQAADDAKFSEACEAFQAVGERARRQKYALRDSEDMSLSAAQRAEAKRVLEETISDKSDYDPDVNPSECSGPVWERYYAEVRAYVATTSAAVATTTQAGGVTWKYLQSEHAKFLGMKCGSDSKSPSYVVCLGLQNAMIDSFERDATALPPSKARADVLGAIDSYQEAHDKYVAAMCEMDGATATDCITAPLLMSMPYDTIVLVVNREAAAQ
ncbi:MULTISPECIES: hypothetical protein [Rhodococcus]|uniref:Uncharacterized protein n=1 Tax=Rhodococcus oxybenzonivorans TaxID=1990687 RepID=A0AAE4V2K0_9NOCA|nr:MULTISPECIES: hypothetical protein [Rhodococcus]MDV7246760.1 hypothetical protein [Rhodococcus oxybenzonivorans]MDV7267087.1 hypothetical protein [Rhodococcus oxybenzonivorans]MDV7278356.1 hypothetical protein [Rhodococcus oxybenzonivorans]MDV7337774.1 hypothetical protein [Rhodococcus oxybenzonivorans]MDV7346724.1 hypothetical protein [Rhodococcus oxybenzonivorans]